MEYTLMTYIYIFFSFCIGGSIGMLTGCILSSRRIREIATQKAQLVQRLQELIATATPREFKQAD